MNDCDRDQITIPGRSDGIPIAIHSANINVKRRDVNGTSVWSNICVFSVYVWTRIELFPLVDQYVIGVGKVSISDLILIISNIQIITLSFIKWIFQLGV